MKQRLGVVGIVVSDRENVQDQLNDILSQYGNIIVGRMGIPYHERGVSVIALIVDGSNDEIGALTGKIGGLPNITVKSALTPSKDCD